MRPGRNLSVSLLWLLNAVAAAGGEATSRFSRLEPDRDFEGSSAARPKLEDASGSRKNVLHIISDDMRADFAALDGRAHTPYIDELMTYGLYFQNAYAQIPQCGPSRTSFLTSRRPKDTGALTNENANPLYESFISLPQQFKRHGYNVLSLGKTFHWGGGCEHADTWMSNFSGYPCLRETAIQSCGTSTCTAIDAAGVSYNTSCGTEDSGVCEVGSPCEESLPANTLTVPHQTAKNQSCTHVLHDYTLANDATRYMKHLASERRSSGKPWYLMVGFRKPHAPFQASTSCFEKHDNDSVALAEHRGLPTRSNLIAWPMAQLELVESGELVIAATAKGSSDGHPQISEEVQQDTRRGYYASLCTVDSNIGLVLKQLRKQDSTGSNTIVIMQSDHGYHLGEHGVWGKNSLFEHALRTPLIIYAPQYSSSHGKKTQAIAELIDIAPTVAALAGISAHTDWVGVDLTPVFIDQQKRPRTYAFSQETGCQTWQGYGAGYPRGECTDEDSFDVAGYSVRTAEWRYTRWMKGWGRGGAYWDGEAFEELYQYESSSHSFDQGEVRNVALNYSSIVESLYSVLKANKDKFHN